jgi:hypothetical protein
MMASTLLDLISDTEYTFIAIRATKGKQSHGSCRTCHADKYGVLETDIVRYLVS